VIEGTRVLNNIDLKGMRVAITGGTSGLGLALVRNLVASRARVAFVARGAQLVERVSKETSPCGIVGDVGLKEDIHAMALALSRQISIGHFRPQNLPSAAAIHEQKQWSATGSRRANRQSRI
jgi:NAD(P)-dependent dehydrogenase (short-subunit alcohol dehydrogenase family)